jgi:O-antigen/teichoic acid export membrane protein
MGAHVAGGAAYLWLAYRWMISRFGRPTLRFDLRLLKRLAAAALPFVGIVALYELYSKLGIVLLHQLVGSEEAGVYAVAVRLVTAPIALAFLVGVAMYPTLSREVAEERANREALFLGTLKWLGIMGVAGGVVLAVAGDGLVVFLFEDAFASSGTITRWMSILFVLQFAGIPYWRLLFATNRERTVLWSQGSALLLNVALNVLLIPTWGAYGVLWASIASEALLVGSLHARASSVIAAPYAARAMRLGASGVAGVATGLWARTTMAWPFAGALALVVFGAVVLASGLVTRRDVRSFWAEQGVSRVLGWRA